MEASGKLKIKGCTIVGRTNNITLKYAIGSIVYRCDKSLLGVLEKVAIKKVNLYRNGGESIPIYVDTYNALYNESDLCSYNDAVIAASNYYGNKITELDIMINSLSACP